MKILHRIFSILSYYYNSYKKAYYFKKLYSKGVKLDIAKDIILDKYVDFVIVKPAYLIIEKGVLIRSYVQIQAGEYLKIGENTQIGRFTSIASFKRVEIGKNCLIAESVSIRDHDHVYTLLDTPVNKQGYAAAPTRIGEKAEVKYSLATNGENEAVSFRYVPQGDTLIMHNLLEYDD